MGNIRRPNAATLLPGALAAVPSRMQYSSRPYDFGVGQENDRCRGHRRLAILRLGPRATQPLHSTCGRYVIVESGAIHNLAELHREREAAGHRFRSTPDTKMLLFLCAADGDAMRPRLRAMLAFVILDRLAKRAFGTRAIFDIKTPHCARLGGGVPLPSHMETLLATGTVSRAPASQGRAGLWLLGSLAESPLPALLIRWSRAEAHITVNVWTASPTGVNRQKGRRNLAIVVLQSIGAPTR